MQTLLLRSRLFDRMLGVLLLSLICLYSNAQAAGHAVTISGVNVPLKMVFKAIKKQTGFTVMYNTTVTMINQEDKITVNFKSLPLDDVLTYLFKGKNLGWMYNDDVIVIYKKEIPLRGTREADSTVTPAMLTGKVTDAAGTPLPGATVQVKETGQGTTTDADGRFVLTKVANGEVVVVSSVGFETRSLIIKGRSVLVQLNVQVNGLDETVVIAYGTTTKRLLVGNVSTVRGEDIAKQPINNPLLALQGRVPGMFITQSNGVPGGDVSVRIQGQNSISSGNEPLYIIDGVPFPAQMIRLQTLVQGVNGGSPLRFINPADIASIDVLKDADATAIYGSRAANGAILITTKKGTAGRLRFDVNFQQGWSRVPRKVDMLNRRQYLDMRYEAYKNDGIDWTDPSISANDLKVWDTTRYTDWQKTLLGNTAQYTTINVGVSGGSATSQYIVGVTWHRESTVFPGSFKDDKASVHFSLSTASLNQKFNMQISGNYMLDRNRLPAFDITPAAIRLEPHAPPLYNSDNTLNWAPSKDGWSTWINPIAEFSLQKSKNNVNNLIGNLVLAYRPFRGMEIRCSAGYTNTQTNDLVTAPLSAVLPEARPFTPRAAVYGNNNYNSWIIEPQAVYKVNVSKGRLESLVGSSIQRTTDNYSSVQGIGHSSDLLLEDLKAATSLTGTSGSKIYKYNALFGRVSYNWEDKYIANVTGRRDGSSRFGPKSRFHNFGSIGLAWIFSEEDFVQGGLRCISFGKLRGSYGTTGNDQIGDYGFLSTYFATNSDVAYQNATGLSITRLPNPYLQWELTRKLQIGLDLGFFNDRILLNATYAQNRSSNQLTGYRLPSTTGYSVVAQNFPATVQNVSWEFSLNTSNLKSDKFLWTSSINLTVPRNKLVAYSDLATSGYANILVVGQPLSITKQLLFKGVDPATGLYQVADSHGNTTFEPVYPDDYNVLINTLPKFYGGVQNSFTYFGIQLDFMFQFVKQKGLNNFYYSAGNYGPGRFASGASNQPVTVLNRWQKPGDNRPVQKYSTILFPGFPLSSDAGYTDASFIRLKTLSASWNFPKKWLRKVHFENCGIYLQGQNLFTLTPYKGMDPETQNLDALPPLRTITMGIRVTL